MRILVCKIYFISILLILFSSTKLFAGFNIKSQATNFTGKVYVISVGINDYSKLKRISSPVSCESDAISFVERIKKDTIFKKVVSFLFLSEASKTKINNAFDTIASKAKPGDVFILFNASQGWDGKIILSDSSTISSSEVFSMSQKIACVNQLFYLDISEGDMFINKLRQKLTKNPEESSIGNLNRIIISVKGLAFETKEGGAFTMSYTKNPQINIMDAFASKKRTQIKFLNALYSASDSTFPKLEIDFFSERDFYKMILHEDEETRGTNMPNKANDNTPLKTIVKGKTLCFIVGCQNFDKFDFLPNTLNDATKIKEIMANKYYTEIIFLPNPTSAEFRLKLREITSTYKFEEGSQFLFFAATHGAKDENGDGVMVFKDSYYEDKLIQNTYSLSSIKRAVMQLNCTNSLILLDICHSGTMFNDGSCVKPNPLQIPKTSPIFNQTFSTGTAAFKNFLNQKTNIFIGSSNDQEAADGKGEHSPFATVLIDFLNENSLPVIDSYYLQKDIEDNVMSKGAISIPQFCTYGGCQPDGRFLFITKK